MPLGKKNVSPLDDVVTRLVLMETLVADVEVVEKIEDLCRAANSDSILTFMPVAALLEYGL